MCFVFRTIRRSASLIVWLCVFALYPWPTVNGQPGRSNDPNDALILEAARSVSAKDFSHAKALVGKILSRTPRNVSAQTIAGIIAVQENNLNEAREHFAFAARLSPDSAETRNNYGAILIRLKRPADAAKEFAASLLINTNQPSALINLSQIRYDENTPESLTEAKILLNRAKSLAPDVEVLRALVLTNLRLDQRSDATANFQEYFQLEQKSSLQSRIAVGVALSQSGLFKESIQELESALRSEPGNVVVMTSLSRAYLGQKDIISAGRLLETAVSKGIKDGRIYAALADVYEAGGYYENAIPAMRLAIDTDKQSEGYRYRYGMLLIDSKAPAAAVIRLKEAIAEFPTSARLWLGLGIAEYYESKLVDAEQSLEHALRLEPKLFPAIAYLAAIKNVGGQSAESVRLYERALTIDEKNASLHYLLADSLLKDASAPPPKVEQHLLRAIALDASLAAAYLDLGTLFVRQNRLTEAAAAFENGIKQEPGRADAYYQLGQVYGRLKKVEESRIALAKFKELSDRAKTQTKSDYNDLVRRLANVTF
jgi:Tfp pilus assembly protein PilF